MRKVWVTFVLLATAFAGCSEDAGPVEDDEGTLVDDELQATSTTGVIRGVVVDTSITPVIGATVKLVGQAQERVTNDDGSFGFKDLEPGTYFLEASKPGYNSVQASATVTAGVDLPPVVRIQMVKNASLAPYVQISQFQGNLRCGLATPAVGFGCSVIRGTEDLVGEYNGEVKEFERLPDWLQVEMFWESTQPAGESLYVGIRHCCDNEQVSSTAGSRGPSPQTAWATYEDLDAHDDGSIHEDGVELSAFPSGLEALEDGAGVRLGVIVDQQFEWFVIVFYNFIPNEGWTFIADGPHPVPE